MNGNKSAEIYINPNPLPFLHLPTAPDVPGTDHITFYKSSHRIFSNFYNKLGNEKLF